MNFEITRNKLKSVFVKKNLYIRLKLRTINVIDVRCAIYRIQQSIQNGYKNYEEEQRIMNFYFF